jgi:hypothetical protein
MKTQIKKYSLLLLITCFISNVLTAQVTGNLILNSRPPSYLSDWNNAQTGQLLLTLSAAGGTQNVKLSTQLLSENGGIIASSNNATAQVITLRQGANIININRVLQLENMQFIGEANASATSLARSGKLSPGNYQLAVQLLTVDNQPLQFKQTRIFTQVNFQLPYLLTPTDKFWLDANIAQTAITFRWSGLVPATQELPIYRLQVYEVQNAQTPMQALRANQPILATDLRRTTQYIWRPQLSLKDSANHIFIWTIQTFDSRGEAIATQDANAQGRSEPRVFGICNNTKGVNACANSEFDWNAAFKKYN